MTPRATLDVYHLPPVAKDYREPIWWGNLLLIVIETTTVALALGSYLYLWRNYSQTPWPPPRVLEGIPTLNSAPDLSFATANVVLLLGSCALMITVDKAARQHLDLLEASHQDASKDPPSIHVSAPDKRPAKVMIGMLLLTLAGVTSIALRAFEFTRLKFWWDSNAYGSLVWLILGLHLTYVIGATLEAAVLTGWIAWFGLDENQSFDVMLMGLYWYWAVAIWLPMYAIVYWLPRFA